jgi:hypothetical protein
MHTCDLAICGLACTHKYRNQAHVSERHRVKELVLEFGGTDALCVVRCKATDSCSKPTAELWTTHQLYEVVSFRCCQEVVVPAAGENCHYVQFEQITAACLCCWEWEQAATGWQ